MIGSVGQVQSGYQAYQAGSFNTRPVNEDRQSTRQITRDPVRAVQQAEGARGEDQRARQTEDEGEGRVQDTREAREPQTRRGSQLDIRV